MRQVDVIKTDYGKVFRDFQPLAFCLRKCAERHHIAMAEDSSRRLWKIKQLLHRFASGFEGEVATGDVLRINHNAAATQRLNITLQAVVSQRHLFGTGYTANPFMPLLI